MTKKTKGRAGRHQATLEYISEHLQFYRYRSLRESGRRDSSRGRLVPVGLAARINHTGGLRDE